MLTLKMYYTLLILLTMLTQQKSFKETQLEKKRVKSAYEEKEAGLKKSFQEKNLNFKGFHLFIRCFKKEQKVETWIKEKDKDTYVLFRTYGFCNTSGTLGPKRREGDLQIPEGLYHVNHFNPESNFHLSMGINYPNASDKILGDKKSPGSAIYIHGNCVTIGCIPITDDKIKELYILGVEARNNGQEKIPVHIYPTKLEDNAITQLQAEFPSAKVEFWKNLQPLYQDFEKNKKIGSFSVDTKGGYVLK